MMQGFESVEQELAQKRLHLEEELAAVRGRMSEIEADLERVHEALGALTGHKKKAKGRSRSRKPATTVEELQQHITRVREKNPFADAGMLERGVRALVKESGSSLTGFKTTFAKALLTSPGNGGDDHHVGQQIRGHVHGSSHAQSQAHAHSHDDNPFAN